MVVESTGIFTKRAKDGAAGYDSHLAAGAKRVVLSAPADDGADLTCVLGVNDDQLKPEHEVHLATRAARPTAWPRSPRCCTRSSASRRA